jgi:hypothetical protein
MDQTEDQARCSVAVLHVFAEGFDVIIGPCRQVRIDRFPCLQFSSGFGRIPAAFPGE